MASSRTWVVNTQDEPGPSCGAKERKDIRNQINSKTNKQNNNGGIQKGHWNQLKEFQKAKAGIILPKKKK